MTSDITIVPESAIVLAAAPPREPTDEELRHTHILLGLLSTLIAVVLAGGIITLAAYNRADTAANTASAVASGNELRACQTSARGRVDDAILAYDRANKRVTDLLLNVLAAGDDTVKQQVLAASAEDIEVGLGEAFVVRDQSISDYQAQIQMSITDPTRFLKECKA